MTATVLADRPRGPDPAPPPAPASGGALVLAGVIAVMLGVWTGAANLLFGGLLLAAAGVVAAGSTDRETGPTSTTGSG